MKMKTELLIGILTILMLFSLTFVVKNIGDKLEEWDGNLSAEHENFNRDTGLDLSYKDYLLLSADYKVELLLRAKDAQDK